VVVSRALEQPVLKGGRVAITDAPEPATPEHAQRDLVPEGITARAPSPGSR
jgi:hypothetical protein